MVKGIERTSQERLGIYVKLPLKLMAVIALAWAGFSFWLSLPWIETLGQSITMPLVIAVILGIASMAATIQAGSDAGEWWFLLLSGALVAPAALLVTLRWLGRASGSQAPARSVATSQRAS